MFRKKKLGSKYSAHLISELKLGNTLAKLMLESRSLELGGGFMYLPDAVSDHEALEQFPDGRMQRGSEIRYEVMLFIHQFMSKADKCLVLEHPYASPTDGHLISCKDQYSTFGDDVYYFLNSPAQLEPVVQFMRHLGGYPAIGYMVELPANPTVFTNREAVDASQLYNLFRFIRYILLGIYDLDSILVWELPPPIINDSLL